MAKYRLKYTKLDKMCYIGHLDLIHIVQRAIKRAGLPIAFSQGFNPHQLMGFALPLPLGMASFGEYVEIETLYPMETDDVTAKLGTCLPDGLNIIGARRLEQGERSAAALTAAASYEISFNPENYDITDVLNEIMSQDAIIIPKKTKTSLKDVDIRQDIYELHSGVKGEQIHAVLSAGSSGYLKPQLLIECIKNRINEKDSLTDIVYTRLDLLMKEDGCFKPLL